MEMYHKDKLMEYEREKWDDDTLITIINAIT